MVYLTWKRIENPSSSQTFIYAPHERKKKPTHLLKRNNPSHHENQHTEIISLLFQVFIKDNWVLISNHSIWAPSARDINLIS